jgi:hypothetical protein
MYTKQRTAALPNRRKMESATKNGIRPPFAHPTENGKYHRHPTGWTGSYDTADHTNLPEVDSFFLPRRKPLKRPVCQRHSTIMGDSGDRLAAPAAEPAPPNETKANLVPIVQRGFIISANAYFVRNTDGSTTSLMDEIFQLRSQIRELQSEIALLKHQTQAALKTSK